MCYNAFKCTKNPHIVPFIQKKQYAKVSHFSTSITHHVGVACLYVFHSDAVQTP